MFRTIISPKHVEPINEKNEDYSQTFVHLVGLYTHCNIMHGTYNAKNAYYINVMQLHTFVFLFYDSWRFEGITILRTVRSNLTQRGSNSKKLFSLSTDSKQHWNTEYSQQYLGIIPYKIQSFRTACYHVGGGGKMVR